MVEKAQRALSRSMANRVEKIIIGNDVWIGEGVFIRRGVRIGDGAVIAARSVVTKDVPPFAIVGGTPASIIRWRFEPAVVDALMHLQWWNYGLSAIRGADFIDVRRAVPVIERNISSGEAQPHSGTLVKIDREGDATLWRYCRDSNELLAHE